MANKLELTWVGKEERIEVEPRILIEVPDKSFSESADDLLTAATFDNMLIHGDNLLALKALESKFAGKANGYKAWQYLFIPSMQIKESSTFSNLSKIFAEK